MFGALFFGWLTDRLGRKKLFFTTIAVYLTATALTGAAWNALPVLRLSVFYRSRDRRRIRRGQFDNSGADSRPLSRPPRPRWSTAASGSARRSARWSRSRCSSSRFVDPELGWRLAFLTGAALGLVVFGMRMWIPESPRWLAIHGRADEGEAVVAGIEERFATRARSSRPSPTTPRIRLRTSRAHAAERSLRGRCSVAFVCGRCVGLNADGGAGVLLQRDLLHLRAGADEILRRFAPAPWAGTSCRSRSAISSGPSLLGPAVRHDRAAGR